MPARGRVEWSRQTHPSKRLTQTRQVTHFDDYFAPHMAGLGYTGFFLPRPRPPVIDRE